MIYLDYGATSFHKPQSVYRAVESAMRRCASPGRGGYPAAQQGAQAVFACRETAAELFGCRPEQVVLTTNCTHGLNIAIRSLVKPGGRVAVSGFEHNAVMRPLYALGENCGGNFRYTQKGIKDCTNCLRPHIRENYPEITAQMRDILELVRKK